MAEFKIYPTDPDFEKFWEQYPKKRAKGDAKKAWHQTSSIRPPTERILNAVMAMSASEDWHRNDGQYIPLPASFLRGERWDDVPEVKVVLNKVWWETNSGIEARAKELCLEQDKLNGETWQQFAARVRSEDKYSNVVNIRAA